MGTRARATIFACGASPAPQGGGIRETMASWEPAAGHGRGQHRPLGTCAGSVPTAAGKQSDDTHFVGGQIHKPSRTGQKRRNRDSNLGFSFYSLKKYMSAWSMCVLGGDRDFSSIKPSVPLLLSSTFFFPLFVLISDSPHTSILGAILSLSPLPM